MDASATVTGDRAMAKRGKTAIPAAPAGRAKRKDEAAAPTAPAAPDLGGLMSGIASTLAGAAPAAAAAIPAAKPAEPAARPAEPAAAAAEGVEDGPFLGKTVSDVRLALIGQVTWLMLNDRAHRHLFLADLEWLVAPPVMLRQMRLWRKEGRPVIYASWALVSDEVEKRILAGVVKLGPQDWNSGDRLWLIDMVAPWGGAEQAAKELTEQVFKGREMKTLRAKQAPPK